MDGPLWTGFLCLACVREKEVGVVEDLGEYCGIIGIFINIFLFLIDPVSLFTLQLLGQFKRLIKEGPSCIIWPLQSVVGRLSLRVQQLDVLCETKTKDNVFIQVGVAVQYRVVTESAYDAWYRLTSPTR
jgi:regulator of protease activity HflC (stomatin/prohibitin superfamily)